MMPRRFFSRMAKALIGGLGLWGALHNPGPAWARTWHIRADRSGDQPTIQAGISASVSGDTVLVTPGTYVENIDFLGKRIVVRSESGPEVTTIDGSGLDSCVVIIKRGEPEGTTLDGFTIRGGRGIHINAQTREGGGVYINASSPTLSHNIIRENSALSTLGIGGAGGGVVCKATESRHVAYPKLVANFITQNISSGTAGGIKLDTWVVAEVSDNVIEHNTVQFGDGGGIWIFTSVDGTVIARNLIRMNEVGDHGGGILQGGNNIVPIKIVIRDNIIANNIAHGPAQFQGTGGGVWLTHSVAEVAYNTIVGNRGEGMSDDSGGGITTANVGTPWIHHNLIAMSTKGGGIACVDGGSARIENNLLWSNFGPDISGPCADQLSENGNIQADPLLCDPTFEDVSVAENSPALSHPGGAIGAVTVAGCSQGVAVRPMSWSGIKALYAR